MAQNHTAILISSTTEISGAAVSFVLEKKRRSKRVRSMTEVASHRNQTLRPFNFNTTLYSLKIPNIASSHTPIEAKKRGFLHENERKS